MLHLFAETCISTYLDRSRQIVGSRGSILQVFPVSTNEKCVEGELSTSSQGDDLMFVFIFSSLEI